MRALTVAVAALAILPVTGCGTCPSGGCAADEVTIEVVGAARTDWRATVAPCLQDAWDWRVEAVTEPAARAGARITVPVRKYDASYDLEVVRCLEGIEGVTKVDIPRSL